MRILHRSLFAVAAVLGVCSLLQAADVTYTIQIHRADKVGESYDVHTTVDMLMKRTIKDANAPAHLDQIHTVGDVTARLTILSLDDKGDPATFTLAVTKFTAGTNAAEVVPAGKVITVTRSETEVTAALADKEELNSDALDVIKAIYNPIRSTGVNDDDIMGSKTPRAVGESWSINAENAAKDLAKDTNVDAKNISGKTTLKGVEKVNGIEALHLACEMDVKDFKPSDMPPQVKVDDSKMSARIDGLLPVDPNLVPPDSHLVMDMSLHITEAGSGLKVEVISHAEKRELISNVTK